MGTCGSFFSRGLARRGSRGLHGAKPHDEALWQLRSCECSPGSEVDAQFYEALVLSLG